MIKNGNYHVGVRIHSQRDSIGPDPCFTKYSFQWGKREWPFIINEQMFVHWLLSSIIQGHALWGLVLSALWTWRWSLNCCFQGVKLFPICLFCMAHLRSHNCYISWMLVCIVGTGRLFFLGLLHFWTLWKERPLQPFLNDFSASLYSTGLEDEDYVFL